MSSFMDEEFSDEELELSDWLQLPCRKSQGNVSIKREAIIAVEDTPHGVRVRLCDGTEYDIKLCYEEVMKRI